MAERGALLISKAQQLYISYYSNDFVNTEYIIYIFIWYYISIYTTRIFSFSIGFIAIQFKQAPS